MKSSLVSPFLELTLQATRLTTESEASTNPVVKYPVVLVVCGMFSSVFDARTVGEFLVRRFESLEQ